MDIIHSPEYDFSKYFCIRKMIFLGVSETDVEELYELALKVKDARDKLKLSADNLPKIVIDDESYFYFSENER